MFSELNCIGTSSRHKTLDKSFKLSQKAIVVSGAVAVEWHIHREEEYDFETDARWCDTE